MDDLFFMLVLLLLIIPTVLFFIVIRGPSSRLSLNSRHVLITGGSSGSGFSLAHVAASEGARVSIVVRNTTTLSTAAESIHLSTGIEVSTYSADIRDYDAVKKVFEKSGEVDVLIVNAGVFIPEELVKQDLEEVKMMLDVNPLGSFNLVKAALPGMKKRKDGGRGTAIDRVPVVPGWSRIFTTLGERKHEAANKDRLQHHESSDDTALAWLEL